MFSPTTIVLGFVASMIVAGGASAASQPRLHGSLTMQHGRVAAQHWRGEARGSRPGITHLGMEALGVTPSYGYGDNYPSYGSAAYRGERAPVRVASGGGVSEGRAAAEEPFGRAPPFGWSYDEPEDTYGRQTPDYGPGITYAAPVSPYRWAYSSENFPGTEFMGGR